MENRRGRVSKVRLSFGTPLLNQIVAELVVQAPKAALCHCPPANAFSTRPVLVNEAQLGFADLIPGT